MKVLFFNPSRAGQGNIPLNLPLLISIAKKYNHDVKLFDLSDYEVFDIARSSYESIFFKEAQFDYSQINNDRKIFYKNHNYSDFYNLNLKKTDYKLDFEKLLNDFGPDIIAVSSLSVDFKFAADFLSLFKEKYNIPVIFGGIHAIMLPDETLGSDVCDYVCIGEGENSFPNLLSALEGDGVLEGVKGIWFKKNDKIIKNPPELLSDITILPIPDFTLFDPVHFYRSFDGKRYKMLNYELSRGCIFNCSYCVNGVLKEKYRELGRYHRIKNIKQSVDELKYLVKNYNFDFIRFWDEDFTTTDVDYLERYSNEYIKEINLPFLIYARADTVTEKKIQILKKMGCKTLAMGIESGSEFIRKKVMNRNITNERIIEKFKLVIFYGIRASAYNIIGLPYESRERIFETIDLNIKANPSSFSVTMLEPYKGTPIRAMCESEGLDPNHEIVYNKPQFIPKGMTYEELNGLFRTFPLYIRFPKDRYEEIKLAEIDDNIYKNLLLEFRKLK